MDHFYVSAANWQRESSQRSKGPMRVSVQPRTISLEGKLVFNGSGKTPSELPHLSFCRGLDIFFAVCPKRCPPPSLSCRCDIPKQYVALPSLVQTWSISNGRTVAASWLPFCTYSRNVHMAGGIARLWEPHLPVLLLPQALNALAATHFQPMDDLKSLRQQQ